MTNIENKSTTDEIRARFDKEVERFSNLDTGQRATIDAPLAMELITQAAASVTPNARCVLDIGCGAGNNTLKLLQKINPLDCDLVDLSPNMLKKAEQRIKSVNSGKVKTFREDFRMVALPAGRYDIILAAAVLHHLRDDDDWKSTFKKIYDLTADGGSVWITDLVAHEDPRIQALMWGRYGDYLKSIGGEKYRDDVFGFIEKEDTPRPLNFQMGLLLEVGFSRVDVLHKNSCFAAFGAVK